MKRLQFLEYCIQNISVKLIDDNAAESKDTSISAGGLRVRRRSSTHEPMRKRIGVPDKDCT